jgi:hypothetical protein
MRRLTADGPMERSTYFLEIIRPGEEMLTRLFRPASLIGAEVSDKPVSADNLLVRKERQTFRRLPRSGALVFGVKTVLTPLNQLSIQEHKNLVTEMNSWPDEMAAYKERHIWGQTVAEYYEERVELGHSS